MIFAIQSAVEESKLHQEILKTMNMIWTDSFKLIYKICEISRQVEIKVSIFIF